MLNKLVALVALVILTPAVHAAARLPCPFNHTVAATAPTLSYSFAASAASNSTATPAASHVPETCQCDRLERDSEDYYRCLTNPACERFRSTSTLATTTHPLSFTTSTVTITTTTNITSTANTTSTTTCPRPSCPAACDCSKFKPKSDEYFQCVTNPLCEKCLTGG